MKKSMLIFTAIFLFSFVISKASDKERRGWTLVPVVAEYVKA